MKEIKIEIPDDLNNEKNSIFSYCLWIVKDFLHSSNYDWDLKWLWNDKIISQFNLVWIINNKFWINHLTLSDVDYFIREYNRISKNLIKPISSYKLASKTPVYLERDLYPFYKYLEENPRLLNK